MEDELGVRLLHRTTRSVSLTPEGEAFLPYASAMIDAEEGARHEFGRNLSAVRGHLRLTAPSIFGQEIVLPLVKELLKQYPEIGVELDLSDRVVDIVAGGYDLAIRIAVLKDSDLIARRLAANPRILCASPAYLAERGTPRTVPELHGHDCIMLTPIGKWPFVIDGEVHRISLSGRFTSASVEAVRSIALDGSGIAMLTWWDVREHLASGRLRQITLEDASTEELSVWALTPSRRYVPSRVKVFLDALERALTDSPAG
nr:LysR family transcriptional regulator [Luteibacter yeojuensis]